MLGAFAGYAGGGGLANATYSNFVRDKGWGMGSTVGAIPSAVGGHNISFKPPGQGFRHHAAKSRTLAWLVALYPDGPGVRLGAQVA